MIDATENSDVKTAPAAPFEPKAPAVLAVDVGGSHVKLLVNGVSVRRRFVSGAMLSAKLCSVIRSVRD